MCNSSSVELVCITLCPQFYCPKCKVFWCQPVTQYALFFPFSQGISDYVPADIELVGYRVFLGNGQYFVSSDVGEGKMQWWVEKSS